MKNERKGTKSDRLVLMYKIQVWRIRCVKYAELRVIRAITDKTWLINVGKITSSYSFELFIL